MTTDTELRDLLAAEAGGPTRGPAGWDDVTRRGRHRQRTRRMQSVAIFFAVVAGLAIIAIVLSTDGATVDTGPPATEPTPSVPEAIDPSTVLQDGAHIWGARADGTSLKLYFAVDPPVDPSLDPCGDLRPLVRESDDQILVGLVDAEDERGVPWADCQKDSWGAIDLRAPVADRVLVDLSTGETVLVADMPGLLFPTTVPAPFDLEVFDEDNGQRPGWWTFRFTAEQPQYLHLTQSSDLDANGSGCDGEVVEVRGTEGCFVAAGLPNLAWDEDGRAMYLSMISFHLEGTVLDELLTIAEGLEPLEG